MQVFNHFFSRFYLSIYVEAICGYICYQKNVIIRLITVQCPSHNYTDEKKALEGWGHIRAIGPLLLRYTVTNQSKYRFQ